MIPSDLGQKLTQQAVFVALLKPQNPNLTIDHKPQFTEAIHQTLRKQKQKDTPPPYSLDSIRNHHLLHLVIRRWDALVNLQPRQSPRLDLCGSSRKKYKPIAIITVTEDQSVHYEITALPSDVAP
ncbi:hypothetical protein ACFX1R_041714 [Malus domestica]